MFKKLQRTAIAMVALLAAPLVHAQVNLTAETASPSSTPGVSVVALAEVAAKHNVANIQVSAGQTLSRFKVHIDINDFATNGAWTTVLVIFRDNCHTVCITHIRDWQRHRNSTRFFSHFRLYSF